MAFIPPTGSSSSTPLLPDASFSKSAILDIRKKSKSIGLSDFETPSFQASLNPTDTPDSEEVDAGFSPAVQRSAVPYLGKYSKSDYDMTNPLILLKLSPEIVSNTAPESILSRIGTALELGLVDSYYMVHTHVDSSSGDFNLVFHGWMYQDKPVGYNSRIINSLHLTGAFGLEGVQNAGWKSIPTNALGYGLVHAHDLRCSPNNMRLRISPTQTDTPPKFWSLAQHNGRFLVTRHVLINDIALEDQIKHTAAASDTIGDLLEGLSKESSAIHADLKSVINP